MTEKKGTLEKSVIDIINSELKSGKLVNEYLFDSKTGCLKIMFKDPVQPSVPESIPDELL